MVATDDDARGYHHGDLAAALMDAAIAHIAEEGTEKLSLRALARECGVSPTAPYRHFPSKRCLLAAIATRGFRELKSYTLSRLDHDADLQARLFMLGRAYVDFALEYPTTYQIMFGSVIEDFAEYDHLALAAEAAYGVVLEVLQEVLDSRPDWDMTVTRLGGITWAAVHGIASLLLFHLAQRDSSGPRSPLMSLQALRKDPDAALELLMKGVLGP